MVTVSLVRKHNALKEEYGRICFNGTKNITYVGLSSVFVKHLQRGLMHPNHKLIKPENPTEFIPLLKEFYSDPHLLIAETTTDCIK